MKKLFSILTAVFTVAVIVLLVTLSFVRQNVTLGLGEPYRILVYNHSTTASKSGGYTSSDKEFSQIMEKVNTVSNLTLFDWLLHENRLDNKPTQDLERGISIYNTDMKNNNIAVELVFANDNAQQDVIVWIDGDSKVVSFDRLIMIIPADNNYSDIIVYFSLGSGDWETQYKTCHPIVLKGRGGEFAKFVKTL